MKKFIITVLGTDRPGIISRVTTALYELGCNLENANQMILQKEFAGFFIIETPPDLGLEDLSRELEQKTAGSGLILHVNAVDTTEKNDPSITNGEIFLVTTIGPDQKGLVARFSTIFARHHANIENLKAVFKGGSDPNANIMTYQVCIGPGLDAKKLFDDLRQKADELDLDIRIQHKNIFDAIHKI